MTRSSHVRFLFTDTHIVESHERRSPATVVVTDGIQKTAVAEDGRKLLNEKSQQTAGDHGEKEVVDLEQPLELEGVEVPHDLPSSKNNDVVGDDERTRLLHRPYRSFAVLELKLPRRVAGGPFEEHIEQREEVETEGPLERGDLDVNGLREVGDKARYSPND